MTAEVKVTKEENWGQFLRKHWSAFAVFVVAAVLAAVGAVYVFVWFAGNAQTIGLVPAGLNLWSMNNLVMFILHTVFWELVLIGIPVAIGVLIAWQWWKRIPEQEKNEYNLSTKPSRKSSAGGAISPLLFIIFAIKVYFDGQWNAAIASWSFDYVVGSMITILIWIAAIVAIPATIGIIWWIRSEMNKTH
jgi:hypothetical protein